MCSFRLYGSCVVNPIIQGLVPRPHRMKSGNGHDTDEWRDYDEDNVPFERLEKVYVPDEDS